MEILDKHSIENSEFIEETFAFWYTDENHIRSPFPVNIQFRLKKEATEKFHDWLKNLKPEAKEEINKGKIAEKLEEIIFETALPLITTEDEKISTLYPFLPRVGDPLYDDSKKSTIVVDRYLKKVDDTNYLHVSCVNKETDEKWDTKFELPA
jgi:hypothetical protein